MAEGWEETGVLKNRPPGARRGRMAVINGDRVSVGDVGSYLVHVM